MILLVPVCLISPEGGTEITGETNQGKNSFVYNDATSLLLVPGGNDISIHPKHPPPFSICGSSVE